MATKSMGYDHPTYLTRQTYNFGVAAAGAGSATQYNKFVPNVPVTVFALSAAAVATGTSTTTALWNGTVSQTSVGNDSLSLIRIANTAAVGAAPALTTQTFGPFSVNNSVVGAISTNTTTNSAAPGYVNYIQVAYGGTATTGQLQAGSAAYNGGVSCNAGDQLYILRGTDATAITGAAIEFSVTPLASVSN